MQKTNKAFTLVELIVVITILAILGTIAFISLQGYSKKARDSKRTSDIANIKVSLELFSLNTGYYPLPDNGEEVLYDNDLLWTQGIVGTNVTTNLSRNLLKKPTDPLHDIEYVYSLASSKKEYEVMSIYEGDLANNSLINSTYASDKYSIKVEGNYNELFIKTSKHIFPVPSLITSATLPLDFDLIPSAIESQVITGGDNFPGLSIPNTQTQTGALKMNLSVYTGSIDKDSIDDVKKAVVEKIQLAYSGSDIETTGVYKTLLEKTTDEELLAFVDDVVLNKSSSSTPVNNYCEEGTVSGILYTSVSYSYPKIINGETGTGTSVNYTSTITCDNGSVIISDEAEGIMYTFTSHTFTNCGQIGKTGPNLSQCKLSYDTIWDENSNYFNITTDGVQEWIVPEGGTYKIEAVGARGGGIGGNSISKGAKVVGEKTFNTGDILYIRVGQSGEDTISGIGDGIRYGGFNGGGDSCPDTNTPQGNGAAGGGASDVRFGGIELTDRIIVAGAGGGACAGGTNAQGGDGGQNGYNGSSYGDIGYAGKGGTQSAGGAATTTTHGGGEAGSLGFGGNGFTVCNAGGAGGGGAGYYGGSAGGGGYEGSGGGGSSYSSLSNVTYTNGNNADQGYIIITKL